MDLEISTILFFIYFFLVLRQRDKSIRFFVVRFIWSFVDRVSVRLTDSVSILLSKISC